MGIKERKLREFKSRRSLILETAKKLFSQKGFVNVTLEDIAQEIEYSKGTIYSHFKSKEEIYAQILLDQLTALLKYLKEAVNGSRNTGEGIKRCLGAYREFYSQHKEYFQLMFFIDNVSSGYRIPISLIKSIQVQKRACLSELQRLLERGKDARELEGLLPEKDVAMVLWGMSNGLLQLTESRELKSRDIETILDVGFNIVINGLIKENHKYKGVKNGSF